MLLPRLMLLVRCNVNRSSKGAFTWHIGLLGKDDQGQLSFGVLMEKKERRRILCQTSPFFLISYWLNFTSWKVNFSSHLICIIWQLKCLSWMSYTMISYTFLPSLKISRRLVNKTQSISWLAVFCP